MPSIRDRVLRNENFVEINLYSGYLSLSYLVQLVGNQSKEYFKMMEFTSTIMVQTKSLSKFVIQSEVLPSDFSNECPTPKVWNFDKQKGFIGHP